MTKAAAQSITSLADSSKPDADLLHEIRQYDLNWRELGRLILVDEDDPLINELSHLCSVLAFQIVITPAHTPRGLAGKRRVMRLADLEDNQHFFDWVLECDAERVAAARRAKIIAEARLAMTSRLDLGPKPAEHITAAAC